MPQNIYNCDYKVLMLGYVKYSLQFGEKRERFLLGGPPLLAHGCAGSPPHSRPNYILSVLFPRAPLPGVYACSGGVGLGRREERCTQMKASAKNATQGIYKSSPSSSPSSTNTSTRSSSSSSGEPAGDDSASESGSLMSLPPSSSAPTPHPPPPPLPPHPPGTSPHTTLPAEIHGPEWPM